MDSVTQLVLGASVGYASGGKKAGKKAIVAGTIAGTIPDLDIVFYPLLDTIQRLGFHRGISHSLLFVLLAAPVFGWVAHKSPKCREVPIGVWIRIGFWSFLTHVLLDAFTVYGTGLFEPFTNYRAAFNSIFIIDPLLTLPLIVGLVPAVFRMRNSSKARIWNLCGLAVATLYLGWTLVAKFSSEAVFEAELGRKEVSYKRLMTAPTAFNSILWRALVETDDGFVEGYYSLLADNTPEFRRIQSGAELPERLSHTPAVEAVKWFSKGFYSVDEMAGSFRMHDLRFGTIGFYDDRFVFTFEILPTDSGPGTAIRQVPVSFDGFGAAVAQVWSMILGRT